MLATMAGKAREKRLQETRSATQNLENVLPGWVGEGQQSKPTAPATNLPVSPVPQQKQLDLEVENMALTDVGETSLHYAAKHGQTDRVFELLERKADLEAQDPDGKTSLHLAVSSCQLDVVKLLLDHKADLAAMDSQCRTSLHLAVDRAKDAEDDFEENRSASWSSLALTRSYSQVVSMTMGRTNTSQERRNSASKEQSSRGSLKGLEMNHLEVVRLLLEKQAEVDAPDVAGQTASHIAAKHGNREVLSLLMDYEADPDVKDRAGRSVVDAGLSTNSFDILTVFVEHGTWSRRIFLKLLHSEGFEAVDLLNSWPQDAKVVRSGAKVRPFEHAKLRERLRAVMAEPNGFRDGIATVKEKFINLSKQNLQFAQEVQVSLQVLPGFSSEDACETDVLESLANASHGDVFDTNAVEAIISAAWQQLRLFTALDIFNGLITVVALCYASHDFRNYRSFENTSMGPLIVALILHAKLTIEELSQQIHAAIRFAKDGRPIVATVMDFDNFVDYCYLVSGWMAIVRQLLTPEGLEIPFMSLYCGMAWLRILWILRGESWMGPRLLPILFALKDTTAFFMVTAISVLAATHAYYNLQVRDFPSPFYGAFLQVVRLGIFGDFDMIDFEGQSPTIFLNETLQGWKSIDPDPSQKYYWMHGLFYMIGIGITVLLMNLLIGVLGQNFDTYQNQSNTLYLRARVKMLRAVTERPWTLRYLLRSKCKKHLSVMERMSLCFAIFLCSPLHPVLRTHFASMVTALEKTLQKYNGMAWILFLCAPIFLPLSIVCLLCYLCCGLFFYLEGMSYTLAVTLGLYGSDSSEPPLIWLLVRDGDGEDIHSLQSKIKMQMKILKEIQRRQQDMESKVNALAKIQLDGGTSSATLRAFVPPAERSGRSSLVSAMDLPSNRHGKGP